MADAPKQTAKQRASFARADRLRKEVAQNLDPAERFVITKSGKAYPIAADDAGIAAPEYFKGAKLPDFLKDARVYLTPRGPVIARPERPEEQWRARDRAQQTAKKAEAQRTTEQKQDAQRKAADRQEKQQQTLERRNADQARKQDQQKTDERRRADQKQADQKKQDAAKLDAQRQEQQKQEAQKRADERRAEAHVAAQFKQQQADQIAEHRRQTARLRTQHREQSTSLKSREGEAVDRHRHDIKTIDDREQQALKEFDVKRRSLIGRAVELVKGKAHFDGRREELQKKFESDRLHKHRDLEALKERQFTALQEQRLKHARERLDMMKTHRQHRDETRQQQDRDRPRLVAERQRAVERNAEIERGHKQEQTRERGPELSR